MREHSVILLSVSFSRQTLEDRIKRKRFSNMFKSVRINIR